MRRFCTVFAVSLCKVRGVFEAGMHSDTTYGVSLLRLRHTHGEEAGGAKIFKVGETTAPASNQ